MAHVICLLFICQGKADQPHPDSMVRNSSAQEQRLFTMCYSMSFPSHPTYQLFLFNRYDTTERTVAYTPVKSCYFSLLLHLVVEHQILQSVCEKIRPDPILSQPLNPRPQFVHYVLEERRRRRSIEEVSATAICAVPVLPTSYRRY
jgi:hypothetical protein